MLDDDVSSILIMNGGLQLNSWLNSIVGSFHIRLDTFRPIFSPTPDKPSCVMRELIDLRTPPPFFRRDVGALRVWVIRGHKAVNELFHINS